MKSKKLIFVILITVSLSFIIISVMTNPNQDLHKQIIKSKLNSYFEKSELTSKTNAKNGFAESLGKMFANAFIESFVDLVTIDNYILFSMTKIRFKNESKIIGIGLWGNVFLLKEFDETSNEALLKQ